MGFKIISKCIIKFPDGTPNTIFDKVREMLQASGEIYHIADYPRELYFEICGNKKINYDLVIEIQGKALNLIDGWSYPNQNPLSKKGFVIKCSEYTETSNGYFFEYEEKA